MLTGPILARELLVASRQPRTYRRRSSLATLMLLILGAIYAACYFRFQGRLSVQEMAAWLQAASAIVVFYQFNLTVWLVPVYVAGGIAAERERTALGDLLTTRLSSAEIVLGKLAAGLAQFATNLAIGFPVMGLAPIVGGVDPGIVLLACVGIASTAFFVGGLSILVSTGCRRNGQAMRAALGLTGAWLILPTVAWAFVSRPLPRLWQWIHPINIWLQASSPFGVFLSTMGIAFTWDIRVAFLWMIGLQVAAGTFMIGWAIARLRPVSRRLDDGEGRVVARLRGRHHWRLIRRPACGESPILWKEMHTAKSGGLTQLSEILAISAIFAMIGYGAYQFGRPAALEFFAQLAGKATTDASRLNFNTYLRCITSVVELICLIVVGAAGAEAIAAERARATWDSLLATPLGRSEVLRGKMIGAAWKARWGIVLLLTLWSAGLLTGSLHPLGVVAALVLLMVATWFMSALGTYASLISCEAAHATARTTIPLVLLSGTVMFSILANRSTSVVLSAGSVPFVNGLCLVSYRDVAEAVGQGTFSYLGTMAVFTNESAGRVLATYLVAVAGYAAAAAWYTRAAFTRFDRVAGRPERAAADRGRSSRSRPKFDEQFASEKRVGSSVR
jgi:ABC-type transport system involved in multi-copper enzyme maturation permease subunit